MKIGLFADPHYSTRAVSCTTRHPSLSYEKIRQAMQAFAKADMVICLGDLVDDCGSEEENIGALQRVGALIRSFNKPFYCLLGNHDYTNFTAEDFYRIGGFARPPFSLLFGETLFVFTDANYRADGTVYTPCHVDWTDTCLPQDQLVQLKELLAHTTAKSVFLFGHQCLNSGVEEHHILKNAGDVRGVLEASGIVTDVFEGHYHPGCESVINAIRYHTLPAMCEGEDNAYLLLDFGR